MNEWWKNTFGGDRIGDINLFPGFWDKVNESTDKAMNHPVMNKKAPELKQDFKEMIPGGLALIIIGLVFVLMIKK